MFGCQNGHIDVVKKLLGEPSCDVNMKDNVSIRYCSQTSRNFSVLLLVKKNCLTIHMSTYYICATRLHMCLSSFVLQDGCIAVDIAKEAGHHDICLLINRLSKCKWKQVNVWSVLCTYMCLFSAWVFHVDEAVWTTVARHARTGGTDFKVSQPHLSPQQFFPIVKSCKEMFWQKSIFYLL